MSMMKKVDQKIDENLLEYPFYQPDSLRWVEVVVWEHSHETYEQVNRNQFWLNWI